MHPQARNEANVRDAIKMMGIGDILTASTDTSLPVWARKLYAAAYREWTMYEGKVRRLLGHLVSERIHAGHILQEGYRKGVTAEAFAAQVAAREPVGAAVHPLKAVAIAAAGDKAKATIERVREAMKAADGDINVAAPDVRGSSWDHKVKAAQAKRSLFLRLTGEDQQRIHAWHDAAPKAEDERRAYFRAGRPNWRLMSISGMDRFIAQAEEMAAAEYDSFICKLVAKVGDAIHAELTGDHVWSHSILTVSKRESYESAVTVERWKTQQIWNVSVLGNHFPQWPTRLMK